MFVNKDLQTEHSLFTT